MTHISYNGLKFKQFIASADIQARVKEIAAEISSEYEGKVPLIVCVLNGAFPFAADIFRNLSIDAEITFIRLKSYSGTSSTGEVKEVAGLSEDVAGRDIIVVEDIIDTGRTMVKLLADLASKKPASLKVATLLHKPEVCKADLHPDYIGFNIPPAFIIGYGLDIDGLARNLQDIWVVDENV